MDQSPQKNSKSNKEKIALSLSNGKESERIPSSVIKDRTSQFNSKEKERVPLSSNFTSNLKDKDKSSPSSSPARKTRSLRDSQLRKEFEGVEDWKPSREKDLETRLQEKDQEIERLKHQNAHLMTEIAQLKVQNGNLEHEVLAVWNLMQHQDHYAPDSLESRLIENEKKYVQLRIRYKDTLEALKAHVEALPAILATLTPDDLLELNKNKM